MRKLLCLIIIASLGYYLFTPSQTTVETEDEPSSPNIQVEAKKPVAKPKPAPELKSEDELRLELIRQNPQNCDRGSQDIWWPDGDCHDRPVELSVSQREQQAVVYYRSVGFTDVAIANLLGTIKQESGFSTANCGDGGVACGIYQWHPGRRYDMPGDFAGQLKFSVVEMQRDSPGTYATLLSTNNHWEARQAIYDWIRWGELGARWLHADRYYAIISS